jgi:hypothetical protein
VALAGPAKDHSPVLPAPYGGLLQRIQIASPQRLTVQNRHGDATLVPAYTSGHPPKSPISSSRK